tara:strand:+ start:4366 stop:4584 length:219 start_codon:yes stop_codon:yes gene_type:complete
VLAGSAVWTAKRPTGRKHALNKIVNITQDETISLWCAISIRCQSLDLHALADWNWVLSFEGGGVVEDSAAEY